tara:strand:- start:773 stop:949 length:177 start_codon:yes stop_codon:yes gene_type:complete
MDDLLPEYLADRLNISRLGCWHGIVRVRRAEAGKIGDLTVIQDSHSRAKKIHNIFPAG